MNKKSRLDIIIYLVGFFLLILGFIQKWILTFRQGINSDNVALSLYYYDMVDHHNFLMKEWNLGRNLLFTDYPLFMLTGITTGLTTTTLKFIPFVIFLLSIGMLALIIHRVGGWLSIFFSSILLAGSSLFASNYFIQPNMHIGTYAFVFLNSYLLLRYLEKNTLAHPDEQKHTTERYYLIALGILNFTTMFSDQFYIYLFCIPVLVLLAIYWVLYRKSYKPGKLVLLAFTLSASTVLGMIVLNNTYLLLGFHTGNISNRMATENSLKNNISLFYTVFPVIFNIGFWTQNTSLLDRIVRSINLILLAGTIAGVCWLWKKEGRKHILFIYLYFALLTILLCTALILSNFEKDLSCARYLVMLLYIQAFFLAILLSKLWETKKIVLALVLFSLITIVGLFNFDNILNFQVPLQDHREITQFLKVNGLKYGYTSYWHANIVTFLSNNEVKVRPVEVKNKKIRPFNILTKKDWYTGREYKGPSFLMVPIYVEYAAVESGINNETYDKVSSEFGVPSKVMNFASQNNYEKYVIYIWEHNILAEQ